MAITVSGVLRRDTRHTVRGWLSHWPVNTSSPIYMTNPPQTDTPRTDGVKFAVSIFEHDKFVRHQTVTTVEHAETLERELNQVRLNFAKEVDRGQAFINRIKEENRQLDYIKNLLAILHCDGGHYCVEHGTRKATDNAIEIVHRLKRDNGQFLFDMRVAVDTILESKKCFEGDDQGNLLQIEQFLSTPSAKQILSSLQPPNP